MEFGFGGTRGSSLLQRNLQVHGSSRRQNPVDLPQRPIGVGDVFQNVRGEQNVDGCVGKCDVLQIDTDVASVRRQVVIARCVSEQRAHHAAVLATEPRARLQDPLVLVMGRAREETEQ